MINRVLKAVAASLFACTMIVIPAASHAFAQDAGVVDASKVPASGDVVDDFIPDGWQIEDDVAGDLNGDGTPDHAITLIEQKPAPDEEGAMVDRGRALVIVFGTEGGGLTKAAVADTLLQCTSCGGAFYGVVDAPANVSISKGVLVVEQDHGSRWVTDTTFRFRYDEQPGMFILIGFDYSSRDRANGDFASESTNYLTGKRITTTGKGKRTTSKTTVVEKMRYSIQEVNAAEFDEAATMRLGLD
jgi:hypothetical protein